MKLNKALVSSYARHLSSGLGAAIIAVANFRKGGLFPVSAKEVGVILLVLVWSAYPTSKRWFKNDPALLGSISVEAVAVEASVPGPGA
jgi:hypothetical protein